VALFVTYLVVASLIAFFTVKIIGIPIGKRMTAKIVLSIVSFIPLYLATAYLLSKFVSRDLVRLERSLRDIPYSLKPEGSWIKEIDRLSSVVREQSKRIKEIIETQRLFIYRMAHDLRTPVANLRNILLGIKEGVIGEEEREEYIRKALEQVDRIGYLLEEALAEVRKVSKRREVQEVDLCGFLRSVEGVWRLRFKEKGVDLLFRCEGSPKLKVSPLDLEEILNNLLDNALKNTERGRVLVEVKVLGEEILLRVRDTGRGMEKGRFMEAYRRGSLGLYIVRELVWRNKGDVTFRTAEGGTEVVVRFPVS
jgi:signal transduction histidine kinase